MSRFNFNFLLSAKLKPRSSFIQRTHTLQSSPFRLCRSRIYRKSSVCSLTFAPRVKEKNTKKKKNKQQNRKRLFKLTHIHQIGLPSHLSLLIVVQCVCVSVNGHCTSGNTTSLPLSRHSRPNEMHLLCALHVCEASPCCHHYKGCAAACVSQSAYNLCSVFHHPAENEQRNNCHRMRIDKWISATVNYSLKTNEIANFAFFCMSVYWCASFWSILSTVARTIPKCTSSQPDKKRNRSCSI